MATPITLPVYGTFGTFLVREEQGYLSREQITLAKVTSGTPVFLEDGTILGRVSSGTRDASAAVPFAWNTGNGTMGAVTADAGATPGTYAVRMLTATTFQVERDGVAEGPNGSTGVAYNGTINFTLTAGGTAFVAGDGFNITVSASSGTGSYVSWSPTATDGSQNASAILLGRYQVDDSAKQAAVVIRDAEVQRSMLVFVGTPTTPQKAAAYASLAASHIAFR